MILIRNFICVQKFTIIFALFLLIISITTAYIFLYHSNITINLSSVNSISDLHAHLNEFEHNWPHGKLMNESIRSIIDIPPQVTIVKVCSVCKDSFWIALPTNLILKYYYFAGRNAMLTELATGIWDTAETRLANAVLSFGCGLGKSSALMIDVGMNHGYFSGMALAAGCRVIAFEPTKSHYSYSKITVALSGHENHFKLYSFAASDKTGEQVPFDDWSVTVSKKKQESGTKLPFVTTVRIDELVQENVLYLKVDVEGNEAAVFKGLTKLLKKKVVLVILWEQAEGHPKENILLPTDYLAKFGYFISERHHGGASNFIALHPQVDPILRQTIMAMKDTNIKEALASAGTDWWNY